MMHQRQSSSTRDSKEPGKLYKAIALFHSDSATSGGTWFYPRSFKFTAYTSALIILYPQDNYQEHEENLRIPEIKNVITQVTDVVNTHISTLTSTDYS